MKHSGRFGDFGGFYVPEVLIPVLEELEEAFDRLHESRVKFDTILSTYRSGDAVTAKLSEDLQNDQDHLFHHCRRGQYRL